MDTQLQATELMTRYMQTAMDAHASLRTSSSILRWRIQFGDVSVWLTVHNHEGVMGYTVSEHPFWSLAHPEDIASLEQAIDDMALCLRAAVAQ